MEPLHIPATDGAEIACDFSGAPDTPEQRFAEYGRLFAHALVGRHRAGNSIELTFQAKPGVAEWLADLVPREAACCPFFSYRVDFADGEITWHIWSEAGEAAQAILDQMYELPDNVSGDIDTFLDRLDERGTTITRPTPGTFAFTPPGGDLAT